MPDTQQSDRQDDNPYRSPAADGGGSTIPERAVALQRRWVFLVGAAIGCVSFLIAIALIPSKVSNLGVHDLLLANYLGFIYPPLVGLWAGWIRRSWQWTIGGAAIGLAIGGGYYLLCSYNFLAVMVAFPCLLGGAASVALGTGSRSWVDGLLRRLGKGLVAGFVLGFVYMVVLNGVGMFWFPTDRSVRQYHRMMWHVGPIAMSIAGGLYLILFVWASNLRLVLRESPELPSLDQPTETAAMVE